MFRRTVYKSRYGTPMNWCTKEEWNAHCCDFVIRDKAKEKICHNTWGRVWKIVNHLDEGKRITKDIADEWIKETCKLYAKHYSEIFSPATYCLLVSQAVQTHQRIPSMNEGTGKLILSYIEVAVKLLNAAHDNQPRQ